ncbi:MAG: hypothetical protein ACI923_002160 [Flavobacteriales bacterium]|jgi:hypothetical protein
MKTVENTEQNGLYYPFRKMDFNPQKCFLSGQDIDSEEEQTFVFPEWIMDRYSLRDKSLKMLEGSILKYKDMKMPCHSSVIIDAIDPLEREIEEAFTKGYDAVIKVPEVRLFQWMAKIMLGVLFNDIGSEKRKFDLEGKDFSLSPFVQERFHKFHLLLQSLVFPMEFIGTKLWSIKVFKIKISKDIFNYKDDSTNLNFSLGMHDFGIVACLQDNGAVAIHEQGISEKFLNKTLHPVQFEEICARFIYANYLLNIYAEYTIKSIEDKLIVESTPLIGTDNKPLFDRWDNDMFAQVLSLYWKPWGITKDEILTFGNSPISYLENNDTYLIVEPESIKLQH